MPEVWRRLTWIVVIGVLAHALIATADTLMLRAIADRREAETRDVAALAAPGADLGEDMVATITGLLPDAAAAAPAPFLPLVARVSAALGPLGGDLSMRAMRFDADTLILDFDSTQAGLAARVGAALRAADVDANVTESPGGAIRVTAAA